MSVWHAHSGSGGRGELWQVFAGDSHALRTSGRATHVKIGGRQGEMGWFTIQASWMGS